MKKRILLSCIFIVSCILSLQLGKHLQKKKMEPIVYEKLNNDVLVSYFLESECLDLNHKPLTLKRIGSDNDGGYVVPMQAIEASDVLMSYGVDKDVSFEEEFCALTKKPAHAFDCGVKSIPIKNPLCNFHSECIGTDAFLYGNQKSSCKVSSYSEQIKKLNVSEKKAFIKMDIEGAEYDCFDNILKEADNITGIVIEIHGLCEEDMLKKAENLLENISKNFILVHLHANNCTKKKCFTNKSVKGEISQIVELTYINKKLVSSHKISQNQKHPKELDMKNCGKMDDVYFEVLEKPIKKS